MLLAVKPYCVRFTATFTIFYTRSMLPDVMNTQESSTVAQSAAEGVSIATAHTVTVESKDHKLVLVAVSRLSSAGDGYQPAIHDNIRFAAAVLTAYPVSVRGSHFKGVVSPGNVRTLKTAVSSVPKLLMEW